MLSFPHLSKPLLFSQTAQSSYVGHSHSALLPSEIIITPLGKLNVNSSVFVWAPSGVQYITSSIILKPYLFIAANGAGPQATKG